MSRSLPRKPRRICNFSLMMDSSLHKWRWNRQQLNSNHAIAKLFKQTHSTRIKLDIKKVILLDTQSTMDMICDPALVESTFKSSHSMRLKSNGGTMEVNKQAIMLDIICTCGIIRKPLPTFLLWAMWLSSTESLMTAMIKCLWCIAIWEESQTWNFGCTRPNYIISIKETVSLLLLILSLRIRHASQSGRSRIWRSQDPSTPSSIIHPGRILNG